jgi:hypothetical protein
VQASGGEGTDIVAPAIRPGTDAVQEQGDVIAGTLLDHPDDDIPNTVWIRDHRCSCSLGTSWAMD